VVAAVRGHVELRSELLFEFHSILLAAFVLAALLSVLWVPLRIYLLPLEGRHRVKVSTDPCVCKPSVDLHARLDSARLKVVRQKV